MTYAVPGAFTVGMQVDVPTPAGAVRAQLTEDRGFIGKGGRRIWGVRFIGEDGCFAGPQWEIPECQILGQLEPLAPQTLHMALRALAAEWCEGGKRAKLAALRKNPRGPHAVELREVLTRAACGDQLREVLERFGEAE